MEINFNNKIALVTGAGRGIGRQLVKQLLSANAKVVALSKTQSNLDALKNQFPSVTTVSCDLSNWKETEEKVKAIGPVDLLVNNAAYAELTKLGEIDEDTIDRQFNPNVKAVINVTQIVVDGMKSRGSGGAIVNVSSIAGLTALQDHLVYGAAKAAMDQMTRILAYELGPCKIRCNSVNPTVIWTDMGKQGWSDDSKQQEMIAKHPVRRFGEPEEVCNAILFLLSDKAEMITGHCLPIDGGLLCC